MIDRNEKWGQNPEVDKSTQGKGKVQILKEKFENEEKKEERSLVDGSLAPGRNTDSIRPKTNRFKEVEDSRTKKVTGKGAKSLGKGEPRNMVRMKTTFGDGIGRDGLFTDSNAWEMFCQGKKLR